MKRDVWQSILSRMIGIQSAIESERHRSNASITRLMRLKAVLLSLQRRFLIAVEATNREPALRLARLQTRTPMHRR